MATPKASSVRNLCVLAAATLIACAGAYQPDPYREYVRDHPRWKPASLEPGMDAREALAVAFAPRREGSKLSGRVLSVHDLVEDRWIERLLPVSPLVPETGERLVVARLRCTVPTGGVGLEAVSYYLLRGDLLYGYMHWYFGKSCAGKQEWQLAPTVPFDHLIPEEL